MKELTVRIKFQKIAEEYGNIYFAKNLRTPYQISIDDSQKIETQILTFYHEMTHLMLGLFYGRLALTADEEKVCAIVEKAAFKAVQKYISKAWKTKKVGKKVKNGRKQR